MLGFGSLKEDGVGNTVYSSHEQARHSLFEDLEVYVHRQKRHSNLGSVSPRTDAHIAKHHTEKMVTFYVYQQKRKSVTLRDVKLLPSSQLPVVQTLQKQVKLTINASNTTQNINSSIHEAPDGHYFFSVSQAGLN